MPRPREHGTPEGYEAGCTTDTRCPAFTVHGMSCETAYYRHISGERRYEQLRGRGLTSTEIARRLGFTPGREHTPTLTKETPVSVTPTPTPKPAPPKRPKPFNVAAAEKLLRTVDDVAPAAEPAPVSSIEEPARARPLPEHGTRARYGKGCRNDCPGNPETGETCREANARDQRERKAKKNAGITLSRETRNPASETPAAENATPQVENETEPVIIDRDLDIPALPEDIAAQIVVIEDQLTEELVPVPLPAADFAEAIEQARDRADLEHYSDSVKSPRPEWAEVAISEDVEKLRNLAARLEQELAQTAQERDAAQRAMSTVITSWGITRAKLAAVEQQLLVEQVANRTLRMQDYAFAELRRANTSKSRRFKRGTR